MANQPKVVGIIFSYQHASFLENLYKSLPVGVFDEVFISDDYSGDGIEAIAERLGIKCFSHKRLRYGGNIKFGLNKALEIGADYIVEIHGDGQYDVNASGPAIEKIQQGFDLVMGSRFFDWRQPRRDHMPWSRYFANIGLSFLARLVTRAPLTEFQNGFRVYSRHLLESVNLDNTSNDFLFGFEIIALAQFNKLKMAEVPIRCFYGREHSSISIPKSIQYAFQMSWGLVKFSAAKLGFKIKLFS